MEDQSKKAHHHGGHNHRDVADPEELLVAGTGVDVRSENVVGEKGRDCNEFGAGGARDGQEKQNEHGLSSTFAHQCRRSPRSWQTSGHFSRGQVQNALKSSSAESHRGGHP